MSASEETSAWRVGLNASIVWIMDFYCKTREMLAAPLREAAHHQCVDRKAAPTRYENAYEGC